jgi:hypothetical protein
MAIQTGSGVTLAIGSAAQTSPEYVGDTYKEVGEVSEIGEFGDERTVVEFIALSDGRVRKARGSANAGDSVVTYAYDSSDDGQDDLKDAFEEQSQAADEFNFRIQFNDAAGSPLLKTTFYFRARITSRRVQSITNDAVVTVQATLAINSPILETRAA